MTTKILWHSSRRISDHLRSFNLSERCSHSLRKPRDDRYHRGDQMCPALTNDLSENRIFDLISVRPAPR